LWQAKAIATRHKRGKALSRAAVRFIASSAYIMMQDPTSDNNISPRKI
jgi:hypothetical protein